MNCGMGRKRSIKSFCRKNTAAVPPQGRAGPPLGGREGQSKNLGRSLSVYHVACRGGLRAYEGRSGSATVLHRRRRRRRRRRNLLATSNLAVRKVEMKGGGAQRAMARSGVPLLLSPFCTGNSEEEGKTAVAPLFCFTKSVPPQPLQTRTRGTAVAKAPKK